MNDTKRHSDELFYTQGMFVFSQTLWMIQTHIQMSSLILKGRLCLTILSKWYKHTFMSFILEGGLCLASLLWMIQAHIHMSLLLKGCLSQTLKDTHDGRGADGSDSADRDGLLGVTQVPRAVRACHDTCTEEDIYIHYWPFYSWPKQPFLSSRHPLRYL